MDFEELLALVLVCGIGIALGKLDADRSKLGPRLVMNLKNDLLGITDDVTTPWSKPLIPPVLPKC